MDGNRRYAKVHGQPSYEGHKAGVQAVKRVVEFCLQQHISYLTLYAFSLENFNRTAAELAYLFDLVVQGARSYMQDLVKSGVRMTFVGDRQQFPAHVLPAIETLEETSKDGKALHVQILFCYGGRQEIVSTVRHLAQQVKAGVIEPNDITDALFNERLWTNGMPAPDLIIRTGGVRRLSNFLLYQAAYSELYFTDTFWPAIQETDLFEAVNYFMSVKRNFGR